MPAKKGRIDELYIGEFGEAPTQRVCLLTQLTIDLSPTSQTIETCCSNFEKKYLKSKTASISGTILYDGESDACKAMLKGADFGCPVAVKFQSYGLDSNCEFNENNLQNKILQETIAGYFYVTKYTREEPVAEFVTIQFTLDAAHGFNDPSGSNYIWAQNQEGQQTAANDVKKTVESDDISIMETA